MVLTMLRKSTVGRFHSIHDDRLESIPHRRSNSPEAPRRKGQRVRHKEVVNKKKEASWFRKFFNYYRKEPTEKSLKKNCLATIEQLMKPVAFLLRHNVI